jgi:WD40 repeat protein/tRNA A-37 threonylcarbamoyl transferase component Bud32
MAQDRTCRECGLPLPVDAPGGACPVCSLQIALKFAPRPAPQEQAVVSQAGQRPTSEHEILPRFGDYELIELVARGGMGVVYKARQISLNRVVALKMIQGGTLAGAAELKRFHAEAEAIAHLQHPNIVAIHQVGEHQGQHFFSMDYVAGRTLADGAREGLLPATRAATYVKTITQAVHYAHEHGIIHRDLKPANVIIDDQDQPHITDFGLAKRFLETTDHGPRTTDLTLSGQVLGSPNYLPPEQADPKRGAPGPASDVYALGGILYHLVTGRPPFQAESLTTLLRQVVETDPVPPRSLNPSISRDLETICLKCLAKEPRHRYATAQSLADDLDRFLNHEPVLARPVGVGEKARRWCRRQPVRAGLIAALIIVFLGGTAGVVWQWRQAQANAVVAVAAGAEARIREYTANLTLAQNQIQAQQFGQALDTLLKDTREPHRGWEWGWLLRSCCQDLMTLSGDAAVGTLAAFSPESPPRLLATAGFTDVISIWDFASGKTIGTLRGHSGCASLTSFSADGTRLCTYGWTATNTTARIWDMQHQRTLFAPLAHPAPILYADLSRDGRRLATGGADGKLRIFDVMTGADTGLSKDYGDGILAVAFSPDGHRLASGGGTWGWTRSQDTSIRVWNLVSGETRRLEGHSQAVFGLAWSPDGRLLVSCGLDGRIKAWEPDLGRELEPFVASPKQRIVCRADFSPDGRLLGVVGLDDPNPTARATLFDVKTRRVVRELAGHSMAVQGIRFSPDGKYIATSGTDLRVKIWSVATPPAFVSLEGHSQVVWTTAFSPDGRRVATGSLDQTARIWDASNGKLLQTILVRFPVVSLAFNHDGQKLVTVGPENSACLWQIRQKAEGGKQTEIRAESELLRLRGHARAVVAVAWSPDDRWIATGSKDTTARIVDANTGELRLSLIGHSNSVQAVAFSPDGSVLATGSADGTARLWSTLSGQCLRVFTNHAGGVLSLAFSPRGRWLATGGSDCTTRLWDTETGRQVHCLSGHVNGVSSVAFSPDGQRLVTAPGGAHLQVGANRDFRIFFWDVASGHQLFGLNAHDNAIYAAAFSADGNQVITAGGDFTARVWTAFPWRSADYPGETSSPLATRLEQYKRQFWKKVLVADTQPRPWTNGCHVYHHVYGDMNLPPAGSKTQPLFPIPPRSVQAGSSHLDLGPAYNVALNETWQPLVEVMNVDLSLAALPAGLQTFGGITFDLRGIVQLRGAAPDSELYPERVNVAVKRSFRRIHVLHGTTGTEWRGGEIASLVLHYAGNPVAEIPIRYGEHVRAFSRTDDGSMNCPNARLAWGADSSANPADSRPRIYQATFLNPKPELEAMSLDYVSRMTQCGPFLLALTVE